MLANILIFSIIIICTHGFVYYSYNGMIRCECSDPMKYPKTHLEVQQIVKKAIKDGKTVKALGSGHSITDIICTQGVPINMTRMTKMEISPDRKSVTVDAGQLLLPLVHFLHDNGLALQHIPCYGGITIGGAMGTGARGSTLNYVNSISQQAIEVTLIDGDGEFRVITETNTDDDTVDINAVRVHLGLLGVVVNVTLSVVDDFKIKMHNTIEDHHILFNQEKMVAKVKKADFFQAYWFPHYNKAVFQTGINLTNTSDDGGDCEVNLLPSLTKGQTLFYGDVLESVQKSKNYETFYGFEGITMQMLVNPHQSGIFKKSYFTKRNSTTMVNPAVGYAGFMMANRCDDDYDMSVGNKTLMYCPWNWNFGNNKIVPEENAFAIDLRNLSAALSAVKSIIQIEPTVFPFLGVLLRFSGTHGHKSLMCIEDGNPTVYIEMAVPMRKNPLKDSKLGIGGLQAISQMLMKRFNARPHWGKNGPVFHSKNRLQEFFRRYPRFAGQFPGFMNKYDPKGIFLNKFGKRMLGQEDEYDVYPKMEHCALQDFCYCSKNTDCAKGQICKTMKDHQDDKIFEYNICNDPSKAPVPIPLPLNLNLTL